MSLYVLDTDILTLLVSGDPVVRGHVAEHDPAGVVITVISVEEQLTGWYTALRRAKGRETLAQVYEKLTATAKALSGLPILSFPEPAILRYEQLQAMRLNVGKMDLRIAAIALEKGATVVTRNLRDFQRVPGLTVEDLSGVELFSVLLATDRFGDVG
jgi:tRNA(fMet)-specific endonuclease VapC